MPRSQVEIGLPVPAGFRGRTPKPDSVLVERQYYLPARRGRFPVELVVEVQADGLGLLVYFSKRDQHGRLIRLTPDDAKEVLSRWDLAPLSDLPAPRP